MKRSSALKFAVGWLFVGNVVSTVILYPLARAEAIRMHGHEGLVTFNLVVILMLALVLSVLYGAWMLRKWAKYPLFVFLAIHLLMGISGTLEFTLEGLVALTFAAADAIALKELKNRNRGK